MNEAGWWYCTSVENKSYYTSKDGWQKIDEKWYVFDNMGYALQDHDIMMGVNKAWYYLNSDCKMFQQKLINFEVFYKE